jgi:hypothetical protein
MLIEVTIICDIISDSSITQLYRQPSATGVFLGGEGGVRILILWQPKNKFHCAWQIVQQDCWEKKHKKLTHFEREKKGLKVPLKKKKKE